MKLKHLKEFEADLMRVFFLNEGRVVDVLTAMLNQEDEEIIALASDNQMAVSAQDVVDLLQKRIEDRKAMQGKELL